jgi:hypothetical protein
MSGNPVAEMYARIVAHEMYLVAIINSEAHRSDSPQMFIQKLVQQVHGYCDGFKQRAQNPQQAAEATAIERYARGVADHLAQLH